MRPLPGPLLVITDRHQARHSIEAIATAVGRGGGRWLLLRDRDLAREERWDLAARLARLAAECDFALSVSTDIDLAAAVGAAGVHLQSAAAVASARRRLGSAAIIGVSAHGLAEVAAAAVDIPVLALGGVTAQTAAACLSAGARGIAVMGEIIRAEDPGGIVGDLVRACENVGR
jgi:thiamine-phosphate pyrophosphorylase